MVDQKEVVLAGGIANAGVVTLVDGDVLRPAGPHTQAVHALLRHVRAQSHSFVPDPVGVDPDGQERLVYIPGDVPLPPFPAWSLTDEVLASTARLLRRYHDAVAGFEPPRDAGWSSELADPAAGTGPVVLCHNDVCPENVVYRDGEAVALLDFDFAAPGRPVWDLGALASMCVPIVQPEAITRLRFEGEGLDPFRRLRVVVDGYGLVNLDRRQLVEVLGQRIGGSNLVRRRAEAGEPAFVEMWQAMGGEAYVARRIAWFDANRKRFIDALS